MRRIVLASISGFKPRQQPNQTAALIRRGDKGERLAMMSMFGASAMLAMFAML